MNTKIRCFISAPTNINIDFIKNIFTDKPIIITESYNFSPNFSFQDQIIKEISKADFLIAIFRANSNNVFYEIGIAEGLEKQIFIIVDKDTEIPFYLQKHIHVKTVLEDNQLLRLSLLDFFKKIVSQKKFASEEIGKPVEFKLHAPEAKKVSVAGSFNKWDTKSLAAKKDSKGNWTVKTNLKPGKYEYKFFIDGGWNVNAPRAGYYGFIISKKQTPALDNKAFKNFVEKLQSIRQRNSSREFEDLIKDVFNTLDLQIVSNEYSVEGKGADFALWDESLESVIGNPIFVEIKFGNLKTQDIFNTEQQLKRYIEIGEAKAGILLYLDKEGKKFDDTPTLNPFILKFDFEDFLTKLSSHNLKQIFLNKRNSLVHSYK